MKSTHVLAAAAALCCAAEAQQLEVIYCEIPSSPKSVVPGALDETSGLPEATKFRAIEDFFVSPDGSKWMVKGRTQQGSEEENIMLLGSGSSGTMFAQEGQPVPGGVSGEVVEFFGSSVGCFNSLNQFAYSLRARGGVASVFQKVVFWNGTTSTIPTQMGDLYTGLVDILANPSGDETVGNSIGSIHLLDDGRIGAHDSTIGNISSTKRPAIFYDRAMFHQTAQTTVTNFAGTGTVTWSTLSLNTFYTSPDGQHWIAAGAYGGTTDILVYDGRVVIEENQNLTGTSLPVGAVFQSTISASGNWFARGRDNSGTTSTAPDWAMRNGVLIAKTGDVIAGTETYGDTFAAFSGNSNSDWVLCANTNEPTVTINEVIVWNGQVVAREGDPVDVDGNGLFDDGAFLGRGTATLAAFQPNDLVLTDDNTLYFLASLRDANGVDLGSNPAFGTPDALIVLELGCGSAHAYCTAGTTTNGCVPSIGASGSASASAGSGFTITVSNLEGQKSGLIFYGMSNTGWTPTPWAVGSTSFLCVKAPTQRTPSQNSGGSINTCNGVLAIDWNAYIATTSGALGTPFTGGETVYAQGWFRDPPAPKTTNLSNAVRFIVCP